ncbi:MAG: ABC transporter ATP-binding protein [Ignavibacteria bacterium]|nr:ABC transporter ATP-binding protein [Ignavibacteria bacterium]
MIKNTVLEIRQVKKYFKDVKAVDGITINAVEGEFIALLGPNGAGKTTLLEMIEGIQYPDEGEILINGLGWKKHEKELRAILGISLQENHFIDRLTVREVTELFGSFYTLPIGRIDEVLDLVALTEKQGALTKNLSGGQKQRLALGIALLNNPKIILLDEPTTGLDPAARRNIWEILEKLKKDQGITMILTTHYMEEAEYLCERIIILDKGTILAEGSVHELLQQFDLSEKIVFVSDKTVTREMVPDNGLHALTQNENTYTLRIEDISSYLPSFLAAMKEYNIQYSSLECRKMTLDDLFLSLTGRSLND